MVINPTTQATESLRGSVRQSLSDLADLAELDLPGDASRNAQVAERLAEELAEAAAMLRALPSRPAAMSGHDFALLMALRTALASGEDIGETIARALARLAAETGGTVAELLRTAQAAGDDENLPALRTTS